jgi:hypothetical protein
MKKVTPEASPLKTDKRGRDFWGPSEWTSLHTKAAVYKPEKAQAFKNYINALPDLLPCEECGRHLAANLKKYPVDNYLGNNHDLFFWTYILHDAVNQQHNTYKPDEPKKYSPEFEKVKRFYFKALGEDCKVCDTV